MAMVTEAYTPDFRRLVPADAAFSKVASGLTFTEGPVWNYRGRLPGLGGHHRGCHLEVGPGRRQEHRDAAFGPRQWNDL